MSFPAVEPVEMVEHADFSLKRWVKFENDWGFSAGLFDEYNMFP